jgi:hypothetical protein
MTIAYPATLPDPIRAPMQSAERRILSTLPGPRNARALQRQRMAGQEIEFVFTYAEAQAFAAWVKNDLIDGGAWFTANWPQPQGGAGTRRFIGAPSSPTFVPNVGWHVTARCVVLAAEEFVCIPWVQVGEVPGVSVPVVFGSAVLCERDPTTGLIWACWSTSPGHVRPIGGAVDLSGTYVLVYDPIALALVDTIAIGVSDNEPFRSIVYLDGFFYVGVEGNSYSVDAVVTKIDAGSRAVVGQGDTDYAGAVSKLGLISRDRAGLYMSIPNGVGSGTAPMSTDAPFPMFAFEAASDWYFNWAYNDYSRVRVYTGYGPFVDLRGAVTLSINTAPYIVGATHLLETRLLVKPCSPIVYLLDVNNAGVLAINTSTGGVQVINATMTGHAMYYSPESDTLYVEGQDPFATATVVKAYQGTTFEYRGAFPTYVSAAQGNHGNSVYLGGEGFVAAEETSTGGRLWRACFPH